MSLSNEYYFKCNEYFKDLYGNNFELTPGQQDIFKIIYEPSITRGAIKAVTQYGKSEVASMALISMLISRREKALLLAHNIVLIPHDWVLRRWFLRMHFDLEEYIAAQTDVILKSLEGK